MLLGVGTLGSQVRSLRSFTATQFEASLDHLRPYIQKRIGTPCGLFYFLDEVFVTLAVLELTCLYIDQAGLELTAPLPSASGMLGLKAATPSRASSPFPLASPSTAQALK